LKEKQEQNTAKEKLFNNRITLGLLEQQRQDEAKQLKAMKERERFEAEKEEYEKNYKIKVIFRRIH